MFIVFAYCFRLLFFAGRLPQIKFAAAYMPYFVSCKSEAALARIPSFAVLLNSGTTAGNHETANEDSLAFTENKIRPIDRHKFEYEVV